MTALTDALEIAIAARQTLIYAQAAFDAATNGTKKSRNACVLSSLQLLS
jgi:hypothetical protein